MAAAVTVRERLVASDPGSVRLALAARATGSLALALAVAAAVTGGLGLSGKISVVVLVLSAVLTMMSTFTASDPTIRGRLVTQLCLPVVMLAGVTLSTLVDRHRVLSLSMFVVVMFVVVWVRRFGPRAFACGMVAWIGYFLSLFLQLSLDVVPVAVLGLATATVVGVVVTLALAPPRPGRRLRRMIDSLLARVRIAEQAADADAAVRGRHLLRVNEAAVLVDGQLAVPGAVVDPATAPVVRGAVLRVELALARLLDGRDTGPDAAGHAALATARADLEAVIADDRARPRPDRAARDAAPAFTPAADLFGGFLPGSAVTVGPMVAPAPAQDGTAGDGTAGNDGAGEGAGARRWTPLLLTTRQALQVSLAAGLAIVLGDIVSGQRYYWAVLACFLAFTGTSTAAETVVKAVQRTIGTVLGVVLAILVVPLLGHAVPVELTVILVALFVGFYLFRVSYTSLALTITLIVAELYELLGTYSDQLLLLRVGETALGAVIGTVVAVVFLPARARHAEAAAHTRLAEALRDTLVAVAEELHERRAGGDPAPQADLHAHARTVDAALQQLAFIGVPLSRRASRHREAVARRLAAWVDAAVRVRAVVAAVEDSRGHAGHREVAEAVRSVRALAQGLADGADGADGADADARCAPGEGEDTLLRELASLHGSLVALHDIDRAGPRPAPAAGSPAAPVDAGPPAAEDEQPADDPTGRPAGRCLVGTVRGTGGALDAAVTLVDTAGRQAGRTRAEAGRFALPLPPGEAWQLVVAAPGHAPRADRIVLAEPAPAGPVVHDVVLEPTTNGPAGPPVVTDVTPAAQA